MQTKALNSVGLRECNTTHRSMQEEALLVLWFMHLLRNISEGRADSRMNSHLSGQDVLKSVKRLHDCMNRQPLLFFSLEKDFRMFKKVSKLKAFSYSHRYTPFLCNGSSCWSYQGQRCFLIICS